MPVPADRAALERDLLRDRAYATIRDAIVDGTLQPGEKLKDADLTNWLGLSRTPIREALNRLEQDGLVESAPQRYTRVAPLDRRAARDAFPIVAAVPALPAQLGGPGAARARWRSCAPPTTASPTRCATTTWTPRWPPTTRSTTCCSPPPRTPS